MIDLEQKLDGVVVEKACKIRPFKGSDDVKAINLRIKFDGATVDDVVGKAVSGTVIQWQNGPGRSKFDSWKNNQTVDVSFTAPSRKPTMPPEDAVEAKAASKHGDERKEYIASIRARLDALEAEEAEKAKKDKGNK